MNGTYRHCILCGKSFYTSSNECACDACEEMAINREAREAEAYDRLKKKYPDLNWNELHEIDPDDIEAAAELYDKLKSEECAK